MQMGEHLQHISTKQHLKATPWIRREGVTTDTTRILQMWEPSGAGRSLDLKTGEDCVRRMCEWVTTETRLRARTSTHDRSSSPGGILWHENTVVPNKKETIHQIGSEGTYKDTLLVKVGAFVWRLLRFPFAAKTLCLLASRIQTQKYRPCGATCAYWGSKFFSWTWTPGRARGERACQWVRARVSRSLLQLFHWEIYIINILFYLRHHFLTKKKRVYERIRHFKPSGLFLSFKI